MLTLCLAGLVFFFFGGGEMSMVYWKVWLSPRSVPAWAGEPRTSTRSRLGYWVYPRVGGGTWSGAYVYGYAHGLSPRGRGNRLCGGAEGSSKGSIPAWAGEPLQAARPGTGRRVYPRVGGGTDTLAMAIAWTRGLSPRGRGNP